MQYQHPLTEYTFLSLQSTFPTPTKNLVAVLVSDHRDMRLLFSRTSICSHPDLLNHIEMEKNVCVTLLRLSS